MASKEHIEKVISDLYAANARLELIAKGLLRLPVEHRSGEELTKRLQECEFLYQQMVDNKKFLTDNLIEPDKYLEEGFFEIASAVHAGHKAHLDWALKHEFTAFPSLKQIRIELGLDENQEDLFGEDNDGKKQEEPSSVKGWRKKNSPAESGSESFKSESDSDKEEIKFFKNVDDKKKSGGRKKLKKNLSESDKSISDEESLSEADVPEDDYRKSNKSDKKDSKDLSKLLIKALQHKDERSRQIKLAPLSLPTWHSDPASWRRYRSYAAMLMQESSIPQGRKLLALQQSVKGAAYDLIKNVMSHHDIKTDKSADAAWLILCKRYNNTKALVSTEIENIFKIQKNPDRLSNIKNLSDAATALITNLTGIINEQETLNAAEEKRKRVKLSSLEMKLKIADQLFNHSIMRHFDQITSLNLETYLEDKKVKVMKTKHLLQFLEREIKRTENARREQFSGERRIGFRPPFQASFRAQEKNSPYFQEKKNLSYFPERRNVFNMSQKPNFPERKDGFNLAQKRFTIPYKCFYCNVSVHKLAECDKFKSQTCKTRWLYVRSQGLCYNCLGHKKTSAGCRLPAQCSVGSCGKYHSTLLHFDENPKRVNFRNKFERKVNTYKIKSNNQLENFVPILPTARVELVDDDGHSFFVRALFDCGSEVSIITENVVSQMNVLKNKTKIELIGLGQMQLGGADTTASMKLKLKDGSKLPFKAHIVDSIITTPPKINKTKLMNEIPSVDLALLSETDLFGDEDVSLLIGVTEYTQLISKRNLIIENTLVGKLAMGKVSNGALVNMEHGKSVLQVSGVAGRLEDDVKRLEQGIANWQSLEVEQVADASNEIFEHKYCRDLFKNTTFLDEENKFVVRMPIKLDVELDDIKQLALSRFFSLERRWLANPSLKKRFDEKFEAMIKKKQIELVESDGSDTKYYLPYQVVHAGDNDKKFRIVFDASACYAKRRSFNTACYNNEVLHTDLFSVLMRFCKYRFSVSADLQEMFLNVSVAEDQRKYLRLVHRSNPNDQLKLYQFKSLPFGLRVSPGLAIQCLNKSAVGDPIVEQLVALNFYVDDYHSSYPDKQTLCSDYKRLKEKLAKNGFELHKHCSNSTSVYKTITGKSEDPEIDSISALGMKFIPKEDCFSYVFKSATVKTYTKATLLSLIAMQFDILGYLAGVLVRMKLLFQKICKLKDLGWNSKVPDEIVFEFLEYMEDLKFVEKIRKPRWLGFTADNNSELIAFSDASEMALGAMVFARTKVENGFNVSLVACKSKVAPLGKELSIAKLEMAALLLSCNLMEKVASALNFTDKSKIYFFSDSQVALFQLHKNDKNNIYVHNRVKKILSMYDVSQFNYVKTSENVSDIISRGITAREISDSSHVYWNGPSWLKDQIEIRNILKPGDNIFETSENSNMSDVVEQPVRPDVVSKPEKCVVLVLKDAHCREGDDGYEITKKFSSYNFLIRVFVVMKRWRSGKRGIISIEETEQAEVTVLKIVQNHFYADELQKLRTGKRLTRELEILAPIIGRDGLMRLGSRISKANIPYDHKFPIILPSVWVRTGQNKEKVTIIENLIRRTHEENSHLGFSSCVAQLRQKYWIFSCIKNSRNLIRNCVICFKRRAQGQRQLMGSLPKERIDIIDGNFDLSPAFNHVMMDLLGPTHIRILKNGRVVGHQKVWIVIFRCMLTKTSKLDCVTDYSTKSFLMALDRLICKSGRMVALYSDRGSNFFGAMNQLDKEWQEFFGENKNEFLKELTLRKIQFRMSPSRSPALNGYIERMVQETKKFLKMAAPEPTLEELLTELAKIENILNSTPLVPYISDDPQNFQVLTPALLSLGRDLESPAVISSSSLDAKSIYQRRLKIIENLWKDFQSYYLSSLNKRYELSRQFPNIKVGDLVLIKNDQLPISQYLKARVHEVIPDDLGVVRFVNVRYASGKIERKLVRNICKLPIDMEENLNEIKLIQSVEPSSLAFKNISSQPEPSQVDLAISSQTNGQSVAEPYVQENSEKVKKRVENGSAKNVAAKTQITAAPRPQQVPRRSARIAARNFLLFLSLLMLFALTAADSTCFIVSTFENAGLLIKKHANVFTESRILKLHLNTRLNVSKDRDRVEAISNMISFKCLEFFGSENEACWRDFKEAEQQVHKTLRAIDEVSYETLLYKVEGADFSPVTLPADDFTEESLNNVRKMFDSKSYLKFNTTTLAYNLSRALAHTKHAYKNIKTVSFNGKQNEVWKNYLNMHLYENEVIEPTHVTRKTPFKITEISGTIYLEFRFKVYLKSSFNEYEFHSVPDKKSYRAIKLDERFLITSTEDKIKYFPKKDLQRHAIRSQNDILVSKDFHELRTEGVGCFYHETPTSELMKPCRFEVFDGFVYRWLRLSELQYFFLIGKDFPSFQVVCNNRTHEVTDKIGTIEFFQNAKVLSGPNMINISYNASSFKNEQIYFAPYFEQMVYDVKAGSPHIQLTMERVNKTFGVTAEIIKKEILKLHKSNTNPEEFLKQNDPELLERVKMLTNMTLTARSSSYWKYFKEKVVTIDGFESLGDAILHMLAIPFVWVKDVITSPFSILLIFLFIVLAMIALKLITWLKS